MGLSADWLGILASNDYGESSGRCDHQREQARGDDPRRLLWRTIN